MRPARYFSIIQLSNARDNAGSGGCQWRGDSFCRGAYVFTAGKIPTAASDWCSDQCGFRFLHVLDTGSAGCGKTDLDLYL